MDNTEHIGEVPRTPITKELLLAEGFKDFAASLSEQDLELQDDPFYFFKGDFKLYDVIDAFYYCGVRVSTMEQLRVIYERETGRLYTKYEALDDTAPVELDGVIIPPRLVKDGIIKAKLKGGPGDGKTVAWPAAASFYIYQYKEGVTTHAAKYQRKKNRKTIFNYIGHTN